MKLIINGYFVISEQLHFEFSEVIYILAKNQIIWTLFIIIRCLFVCLLVCLSIWLVGWLVVCIYLFPYQNTDKYNIITEQNNLHEAENGGLTQIQRYSYLVPLCLLGILYVGH